MIKDALHYADLGLSVIPIHGIVDGHCTCNNKRCSKPGKHPRIKWRSSSKKRMTKEQLVNWWKKFPDSNVGIVTGEISGIAVLDIDGDVGIASLKRIGIKIESLPVTPTAKTGGGGYHLIFKMCPEAKTRSGILPNIDIRAGGGLIAAPPSLHKSGNTYMWIPERAIGEVDIAKFDFALLQKNQKREKRAEKASTTWYDEYLSGKAKGMRNDSAARLAGRYFSLGMSQSEVHFMLNAWNKLNRPSLPEAEIETVVNSIREKEHSDDTRPIKDSLELISSILKIKLDSVKRVSGDEPQYMLEFSKGTCPMTIAQMLSPKLFQQCIAESTKTLVRRHTTKTIPPHDRLAQLIIGCAEDVDAGIEATSVGEIIMLLNDFLMGERSVSDLDKGDEMPIRGSFRADGILWAQLEDIVQRGAQRWGIRIPIKSMAQRLRAMGINRRVFEFPDGSSKTMWDVDINNKSEG